MDIDSSFDFSSDTPGYWDHFWENNGGHGSGGKNDPDALSPTLRSYHQMLCDSAVNYIKKHYADQNLSLNQIADQIQITPSYLSSLFKKYKQQNISTYITNIRIEKACLLLKTTSNSLKEISAMVGYSNQYYFSSCFKKLVGVNPSAYR